MSTYVWEGRFQPIHRGHVAYVGELLRLGGPVVIVVVANEVSDQRESPVKGFSRIVDEHHRAEKNPWPHWLRHRMVLRTLTSIYPDADLTVLAGHRLDLDWELYNNLLPPDRVFAVPTRDDFEDAKAAAWTSLGQEVHRVDTGHLEPVSGTLVRSRLDSGASIEDLVHPVTSELLRPYLES